MNLPLVKNYLDCHQYLEEVYHYNKSINPDFSYQSWSEDLQVKSKSFLRQAILGKKNISSELTEKLATWLNLSPGDRQHFTLLVEHTQCTVPEIKKILSQQLLSQIRQDQQVPAKVSQLSKSDPLFLQIRDVLSFKDVRHSAESLSRIFHKPAPVIHEALDFLGQIHWIQKDQYSWSATENSIKIEDDHGNSLIQDFHAESLNLSRSEYLGISHIDSIEKVDNHVYKVAISNPAGHDLFFKSPTEKEILPEQKYLKFVLKGSYVGVWPAFDRIFKYVSENSYQLASAPCLENYINDPSKTPENELLTELLVPIK